MKPDLDDWLPDAALRVAHERSSDIAAEELWDAARAVRLCDTRMLGRLVRWRIPGLAPDLPFDELFRCPPFTVLRETDRALVSGLVGRIWTLRRDYPKLDGEQDFRDWSRRGTVKVVFANWVQAADNGRATLGSEARVAPVDREARLGMMAVRPVVRASQHLIASDGIEAALRLAQRRGNA